MAEAKIDSVVKSVEALLAEKDAVAAKEKELINSLNVFLGKIGYEIVVKGAGAPRRGRPPGSRPRRRGPGRPPKAKSRKRGRPPKAKTRRRGRPPKAA